MKTLLTPKDLAAELAVSKQWVLVKAREKVIPAAFRCGKVIRFDLEEVMEALAKPK